MRIYKNRYYVLQDHLGSLLRSSNRRITRKEQSMTYDQAWENARQIAKQNPREPVFIFLEHSEFSTVTQKAQPTETGALSMLPFSDPSCHTLVTYLDPGFLIATAE